MLQWCVVTIGSFNIGDGTRLGAIAEIAVPKLTITHHHHPSHVANLFYLAQLVSSYCHFGPNALPAVGLESLLRDR